MTGKTAVSRIKKNRTWSGKRRDVKAASTGNQRKILQGFGDPDLPLKAQLNWWESALVSSLPLLGPFKRENDST